MERTWHIDPDKLRERLGQWRAFNEWEQQCGELPLSPEELLRWYSDAWDFSLRYSPGWRETGIDMQKVARIRRMREAFARLRSGSFAS